jgi:hypothetical protein
MLNNKRNKNNTYVISTVSGENHLCTSLQITNYQVYYDFMAAA